MSLDAGIGVANTMMASKADEETCSLGNTRNITNVNELIHSVNCEDVTKTSHYAYIYGGIVLVLLLVLVAVSLTCNRQGSNCNKPRSIFKLRAGKQHHNETDEQSDGKLLN